MCIRDRINISRGNRIPVYAANTNGIINIRLRRHRRNPKRNNDYVISVNLISQVQYSTHCGFLKSASPCTYPSFFRYMVVPAYALYFIQPIRMANDLQRMDVWVPFKNLERIRCV